MGRSFSSLIMTVVSYVLPQGGTRVTPPDMLSSDPEIIHEHVFTVFLAFTLLMFDHSPSPPENSVSGLDLLEISDSVLGEKLSL